MPARSPSVASALLLAVLAMGPLTTGVGGDVDPAAWWEHSGLDADGDGLDDALDGSVGVVRVLVDYAAPPTAGQLAALEATGAVVVRTVRVVPVVVADVPAVRLDAVARAPGVVLVEADRALVPLLDTSRRAVEADDATRSYRLTGRGTTIAILDTGVDPEHPDLKGRIVAHHDATAPEPVGSGFVGGQPSPVVPRDTDGHGTHVAGIAAGPGTASGGAYVGVAPGAALANVKVFDTNGDASSNYVLNAIDWVLDHRQEYRIRVMVMSLGGKPTDGTDALSRAVNAATDRGVLTVAAAGNNGPDKGTVGIPGVAARALTVGATDDGMDIAHFSARGPTPDDREKPDMVAPGVRITSTMPSAVNNGNDYGELSGTSMAAPHVAGAAAVVWQANSSLTPDEVKAVLIASSVPTGPDAGDWHAAYGWGFLDVEAAARGALDPASIGSDRLQRIADAIEAGGDLLDELQYYAGRLERAVPPYLLVAAGLGVLMLAEFMRRARRRAD